MNNLKKLSRRIRLALHRHDRIECWCELTAADAPRPKLPVQQGSFSCADCWAPPGYPHELSCPEVSPELFADFLAWRTR